MELEQAFERGFEAVKAYCDTTFAAFEARLAAIEARPPLKGEKGDKGDDAEPVDILALTQQVTEKVLSTIELPKDGEDGKDGKDADPEKIKLLVREAVSLIPKPKEVEPESIKQMIADAMAGLPKPEKGDPGKDADPEKIAKMVAAAVAALPAPEPGRPGNDGVGLAGAIIDRQGHLIVTLSDGETISLGLVVGRDGDPGAPGQNGFGFEDMSVEYDGERDLRVVFEKGESRKEFLVPLSHPLDRGVWKAGETYEKGDGTTFDGSWWIAQKETTAQPGTSPDWRMAVRKGRNGRDGIVKTLPPPGPVKL